MKHNVLLQPALIFKCLLICYQTTSVNGFSNGNFSNMVQLFFFLSDLNFQDWAELLLSSVSVTPENLEICLLLCRVFLFNLLGY